MTYMCLELYNKLRKLYHRSIRIIILAQAIDLSYIKLCTHAIIGVLQMHRAILRWF